MNSNDIADYLHQHPYFFEEHAELLAQIKLTSPVMGRTISLQERQMEIVREKLKALELRLSDLTRLAHENQAITQKFQQWARELLLARNDVDLPFLLSKHLQDIFNLPHATLRLWNVAPQFKHTWFAADTTEDVQLFAKGLSTPFCGKNQDFEAAKWIDSERTVESIAMLPLSLNGSHTCFGLLVLGSDDVSRFTKDMATDFLSKIADTSSAALACLIED
ncbi:MAG: DUF484 family protein [Undibacterium sp.]|nr:DUF484 family protein [Undibacterium sp.]